MTFMQLQPTHEMMSPEMQKKGDGQCAPVECNPLNDMKQCENTKLKLDLSKIIT